jgi:hypothetical protein
VFRGHTNPCTLVLFTSDSRCSCHVIIMQEEEQHLIHLLSTKCAHLEQMNLQLANANKCKCKLGEGIDSAGSKHEHTGLRVADASTHADLLRDTMRSVVEREGDAKCDIASGYYEGCKVSVDKVDAILACVLPLPRTQIALQGLC